jgi:hypothetical protein
MGKFKSIVIDNLNAAQDSYHDDVRAMSDEELWDHCFADDDIMETDFCAQELKRRFLMINEFEFVTPSNSGTI